MIPHGKNIITRRWRLTSGLDTRLANLDRGEARKTFAFGGTRRCCGWDGEGECASDPKLQILETTPKPAWVCGRLGSIFLSTCSSCRKSSRRALGRRTSRCTSCRICRTSSRPSRKFVHHVGLHCGRFVGAELLEPFLRCLKQHASLHRASINIYMLVEVRRPA